MNNRFVRGQEILGLRHAGGAVLIVCALGAVAHAQDRLPPGLVATFDVQQRFEYSDNPDLDVDGDSEFYGRTVLGFGLDSIRNIDRFALDLRTDIEEGRDNQPSLDVTNTFGTLLYSRETRNSFGRVFLRYSESDVTSGINGADFDQDGNVINPGDGTRTTYGLQLEGAVGREAPVGASFRLNQSRTDYSDTAGTGQQDNARSDFEGRIDFRLSPRITASLTTLYRDFDARGDGVDRKTTGFGSSLRLLVSAIDTVNISLSQDRIERSGDQTGTDEGLSGEIGWQRDLSNGTLAFRYASDVSSNSDGRRAFLSVNRTMLLPRGSLSLTAGTTGADTVGTDPLFQADYVYNLPTAVLTLGLSQTVNTDNNNNEEINTRLRATYGYQINSVSSLGLGVSFFDRNELRDNPNDGQRLDIDLTYRHSLTEDWRLVSGILHRRSTQDDAEDRSSNTVFVGLERAFSWRP